MSERTQVSIMHMASIALAAFLAAIFVNVLTYYGPIVEGSLLPVAKATQVNVVQADKERLIIEGTMDKRRNCELLSTAAYITDAAGQRVLAQITTRRNTILRPVAKGQNFGPWEVSVPVWYKSAMLTAVTIHQCHPLWQTRSVYFTVKLL